MERDIDWDHFMSAEQAQAYGLVDEIIRPRRGLSGALSMATALETPVPA